MLKSECFKNARRTAFTAAIAAGMLTHLFGLVNTMHNYDNMPQQPGGFGTGIPSGRWLLEVLKSISAWCDMDYNLPVVNGVLLIILLAVAAGFAVAALGITRKSSGALLGALFVVFPTVTSTMFFRYSAHPYGLGILLAVLAAWVLPRRGGLFLSALLTALTMGIYQAYTPITIGIFVIRLIRMSLEGAQIKDIVRKGLTACGALILGVIAYFVLLKIFLWVYDAQLNNYKGMQSMGQLSLAQIPGLVKQAYKSFLLMPFQDYASMAYGPLLKICWLLLAAFSGVLLMACLGRCSWWNRMAALALCLILPLAVNFMVVMFPGTNVYTMMVYSFALVPCVPLVLLELLPIPVGEAAGKLRRGLHKCVGVALAAMIFLYGYQANVNYQAQYYANHQMSNYVNALVTQIRMTEGFDAEKKWTFLGKIKDPLRRFTWEDGAYYGGNVTTGELLNSYSQYSWFYNYLGYWVPRATEEEAAALAAHPDVRAMPCWPSQGSICVIDEYVVVKFQELSQ